MKRTTFKMLGLPPEVSDSESGGLPALCETDTTAV
jgi:hypothetical protein